MARLEILFHQGCLCEQTIRALARESHTELPGWEICIRQVAEGEVGPSGIIVWPAFVLEGKVLATGIPKKEWLVARLKEWEQERR